MPPIPIAIALGSNLGDRPAHLRQALLGLARLPETRLLAQSDFIEVPAVRVGEVDPGGPYLNAAALLESFLEPRTLLHHLHEIERRAGRDRSAPRGSPRPLDLDIILFGDLALRDADLTIPHPALAARDFVLIPLTQICPDANVPTLGKTVRELRSALSPSAPAAAAPRAVAWAFLAAAAAFFGPATPATPARPPTNIVAPTTVSIADAWKLVRGAYREKPVGERQQITVRTDRGTRRDSILIRWRPPAVDPPATAALLLELGSLKLAATNGTIWVIDVREASTYFRKDFEGPLTLSALADAMPPIPLPQIAWATATELPGALDLLPTAPSVVWSAASLDLNTPGATLVLKGRSSQGDVVLAVDPKTGRMRHLAAESPGFSVEIAFQAESPEPIDDGATWAADRRRVPSVAGLRAP